MSATIYEVTEYAAACLECKWYGYLYDENNGGKELAEKDMTEHNKEFH